MADPRVIPTVVWICPEDVLRDAQAVIVASGVQGDELKEALSKLASVAGYYVEVLDQVVVENVARAELGSMAVWIDLAPGDSLDGAGHYEAYDAERHGDPYRSHLSRDEVNGDASEGMPEATP